MIPRVPSQKKLSSSQISVAAEAFATAQFALAGFEMLEQVRRARFYFDLVVARSGGMMKISVYASFNGFWDLVDRYLDASKQTNASAADYHHAISAWLGNQSLRATCCLVQFEPADLHRMPRLYLASPGEVAAHLHDKIDQLSNNELGLIGMDIVHRLEGLPVSWRFSQARIAELMELPAEEAAFVPRFSETNALTDSVKAILSASVNCPPLMN
jgi:hypothetical protein